MRFLDYSFRRPEENLAFDEVLLDMAENGRGQEVLRLWESPIPFVTLGVSQALRQEVFEQNCLADGVWIHRRCSAGGCVMQGPGCLNYTLVLSHENHPEIKTIRDSYCYILGAICQALQARGVRAHHKGVSDIAVRGKKFSGNAQKRKRRHILHHGTLLYTLDIETMTRYIREPADRPEYRGTRDHKGFLTALDMPRGEIKHALCEAFNITEKPLKPTHRELEAAKLLAQEKYRSRDWVHRR